MPNAQSKTSLNPNVFTFKIGGEAGFGIMSAGLNFAKVATRSGYHTFDYTEYPSLVRGGHNVMQISVSKDRVDSQYATTDFLVALNQETLNLHEHELIEGSGVLYDSDHNIDVSHLPSYVKTFELPLTHIIKEVNGSMVMRNSIAIGAALALLDGDLNILKTLIEESFGHKKNDVVSINHKACQIGYDYVLKEHAGDVKKILTPISGFTFNPDAPSLLLPTGNEAIALGAVASGMSFASIYPMTPTSNILHSLAPHQEKYGFVYKQPEDEISAINMAIGAAHAGARSMVATSGGGFALMSEGYGLAGITETPVVIIEGMRGSPATGLPTWTEQGDLRFVLHAHQGDFPRIVLAPGDVEEAFHASMLAFNLAEKYQTPVVVLVDKFICESHSSVAPFDYSNFKIDRGKLTLEKQDGYKRFAPSPDGISLRTVAGSGNHFVANSDEHDKIGYSNEEIENRNTQMNKRMQKLVTCSAQDMQAPVVYGPKDADVTIVSWGSNKGPILEALKVLPNVNYVHITWINPFPVEKLKQLLDNAKYLINIEANFSGQMHGLIKQHTSINILNNFVKYDGRPFYPEEIVERVKGI
ncbi:MAG: 2-oxoacid:acceptor oxidoreductase subunit alpha [Patescibacteria group bacterium]